VLNRLAIFALWACLLPLTAVEPSATTNAVAGGAPTSYASRAQVIDLPLRYVNNEVITINDVFERNQQRRSDFQRRGLPLPESNADLKAFSQVSLEQLTDEILLVQQGRELGIGPDRGRIALSVAEEAKYLGTTYTLRLQAERRKVLERRDIIEMVLTFLYDRRAPMVAPAALEALYRKRAADFRHPARVKVLQLVLRPAGPAEVAEARRAGITALTSLQQAEHPDLLARVATVAALWVDTPAAAQDRVLRGGLADLGASATTALSAHDLQLVTQAAAAAVRLAALRDRAGTQARAEALQAALAWANADSFRAAVRAESQGAEASLGGDVGWVEPDRFPGVDLMALPIGRCSQVVWIGDVVVLLHVLERDQARTQSFPEVSAQLEGDVRTARREEIRAKAVAVLRRRAAIKDLQPISGF